MPEAAPRMPEAAPRMPEAAPIAIQPEAPEQILEVPSTGPSDTSAEKPAIAAPNAVPALAQPAPKLRRVPRIGVLPK